MNERQVDPPLELTVAPVAALTPTARREIIALCTAAFDEDFTRLFELLPDSTHVCARLAGRLVGHACWVTRWLQPEGLPPLRTAYVEAVATDPGHQGRGVGRTVMRRVAAEIQDYELGGLSPSRFRFYEHLGWELWRGPTAIRTESGLLPTPGEEVMILRTPHTPSLDLTASITVEWREGEVW